MIEKFDQKKFNPSNVLVLYPGPRCLDGFGAAYSAWRAFGDEAVYTPVKPDGAPPPVDGKDVFVLAFSYPRDVLESLAASAKSLTVLDHHRAAEEALKGLSYTLFDPDKSGAGMAWGYFHPDEQLPDVLKYVQDWDLWKFEYDATKDFCAGMGAGDFSFLKWDDLVFERTSLNSVSKTGKTLLDAFSKEVDALMERRHFLFFNEAASAFDGMAVVALACNAPPRYAAEMALVLAKRAESDFTNLRGLGLGVVYSYDGLRKEWQFYLRSIGGFDAAKVAWVYGGVGHKNAAGFSISSLQSL
jgi:hypothetical protein